MCFKILRIAVLFFCWINITSGLLNTAKMQSFVSSMARIYGRRVDCKDSQGMFYCNVQCSDAPFVCENGECFCHYSVIYGSHYKAERSKKTPYYEVFRPLKSFRRRNQKKTQIEELVYNLDRDYYFSSLRERHNVVCESPEGRLFCKMHCKHVEYICHEGKCYCHNEIMKYLGNIRTKKQALDDSSYEEASSVLHPALRHHIAHFCPNLDVARRCIRVCMKRGMPAFCGKDHICYCGHRYTSHDRNIKVDPRHAYADFKDLYKKYFGSNEEEDSRDYSDESYEDREDIRHSE